MYYQFETTRKIYLNHQKITLPKIVISQNYGGAQSPSEKIYPCLEISQSHNNVREFRCRREQKLERFQLKTLGEKTSNSLYAQHVHQSRLYSQVGITITDKPFMEVVELVAPLIILFEGLIDDKKAYVIPLEDDKIEVLWIPGFNPWKNMQQEVSSQGFNIRLEDAQIAGAGWNLYEKAGGTNSFRTPK